MVACQGLQMVLQRMQGRSLRTATLGTCLDYEVIAWPQQCHESAGYCRHPAGGDNSVLRTLQHSHLGSESLRTEAPSLTPPQRNRTGAYTLLTTCEVLNFGTLNRHLYGPATQWSREIRKAGNGMSAHVMVGGVRRSRVAPFSVFSLSTKAVSHAIVHRKHGCTIGPGAASSMYCSRV